MITSERWFVSDFTLHSDLKIKSIDQIATKHKQIFLLHSHTNLLVLQITSNIQPINSREKFVEIY